ncbi:MAG: hypothetical protein GXC73_06920 [Chitinophagaceae bacterium]|nr:hypothetical protein [Chitinophagaceae bacterium]
MKTKTLLLLFLIAGSLAQAQKYNGQPQITKEQQLNEQYCTGLFKTAHGIVFDFTDNITAHGFTNILYWLQGRVAGLQVYTSRAGTAVPFIRNQPATVFLDEMPVQLSTVNLLSVADIAMIKIIKQPFGGNLIYGTGGAIAIYTFRGEEEED